MVDAVPQKTSEKPEKVRLFGGITYWSKILVTLDSKLEMICQKYGYGEIGLTIIIHNGKIMYTLFKDEIKVKEGPVEK